MRSLLLALVAVVSTAACTVNQTAVPALTGPSTYSTAVSVTANPDTIALGQTATTAGQQSLVIATVLDANGQPAPNQMVRFETLVNGNRSDCGQLSQSGVRTDANGHASTVFIAPGTPPDCPNFNADGTVTIRATPTGTDFQATSSVSSGVNIFMALPNTIGSTGPLTANISISQLAGTRNFLFDGSSSVSPGHSIATFVWTFSDGASQLGAVVDHDFASSGTYVVTLTVTDDIGQAAFKTALVVAP